MKIRDIKLEHVKAWAENREMQAAMFVSAEVSEYENYDSPAVQRAIRMQETFREIQHLLNTLEF